MKRPIVLFLVVAFLSGCDYVWEETFDTRDRITGRYYVDEFSRTYQEYAIYSIYVLKGGRHDVIYIDDLYATGVRVKAYYSNQRITIPYQVVNGYEIDGEGRVFGNTIQFTYSVYDRINRGYTDYLEADATFDY